MKRQNGVLNRRIVWLIGLAMSLSIIIFGGVSAALYGRQSIIETSQTAPRVIKTNIAKQASEGHEVLGESNDDNEHHLESENNVTLSTPPQISGEYMPILPEPEPAPAPVEPPIEIIKPLPRPMPLPPPCGGCGIRPVYKDIACPMTESSAYVCAIENT